MRDIENIGLIGGGQMGEAIIRGILEAGVVSSEKVMVAEPAVDRSTYLKETYSIKTADDERSLAEFSSIIILAVKPQIADKVLGNYREFITDKHLIISIAAGITIKSIEQKFDEGIRVIRVMPNTPALVLAGASALSPNTHAVSDDVQVASAIFSAIGTCVEVNEDLLDAVTGLSGSGPGYVFTFMEAMIDGGVLAGLPRPVAEQLVLQTVYGSAKLALDTGEHCAVLKGRVTSPGGTTITGLQVLEEAGIRGAVMTAVESAAERSRELGK